MLYSQAIDCVTRYFKAYTKKKIFSVLHTIKQPQSEYNHTATSNAVDFKKGGISAKR